MNVQENTMGEYTNTCFYGNYEFGLGIFQEFDYTENY